MLLQQLKDQLHSHAHFLTSSLEALQQGQRTPRHSKQQDEEVAPQRVRGRRYGARAGGSAGPGGGG